MKKLFFILALSCLLLSACMEDTKPVEEPEKEEVVEVKKKEKVSKEVDYTLNAENITKTINDTLDKKTDENKKRVIKIDINDKNYVTAHINADKALNATTILKDANKVFPELKKYKDAEQLNIFWYATSIDDKGNEKEIEIVKTGFTREMIDTINFDKFPIESYETYALPYFIHPSWEF